ncbi:hypothetical protein TTRE_0000835101 [Trichuris trichiura]|uniref:Uncharacterized protein n=1 Tax=Trichuris trichiura TaxID=36087 RepID=A0A077ZJY5_TRITR|nr:hypothetical protein TTRE_0000835101 [Trichuris trichiura]
MPTVKSLLTYENARQSLPIPQERFSHVHIDIVGPLPRSRGYSYLLTMQRLWCVDFFPLGFLDSAYQQQLLRTKVASSQATFGIC